ncbi:hypothetical protein ABT369_22505 [Dactylosporangium sp. NPDC000244]|uniref:hypothetical protein n=1 Tax=Dactylosporangium sp. NPDC000244 TaxID=3154365 RepID=UPI003318EC8B
MSMAQVLGGPFGGVNDFRKRLSRFSCRDVLLPASGHLKVPELVPKTAACENIENR